MARFVERFKVMQKDDYSSRETELANDAELRAESGTDADDLQVRMQRTVRRAVIRAESGAERCAEPFADTRAVVGAEPRAVICAVVLADDCVETWQHCRNELQKPCRTCP